MEGPVWWQPVTAPISDGELGERLAARTLELIDIPSESRGEAPIAAHVPGAGAGGASVRDLGDTCLLAGDGARCSSRATSTRCPRRATAPAAATPSASTGSAPAT